MVTAHEADTNRNFLEEISKNKYNQGGLTLKDFKTDTFESNEKSKLSFRQWSDEFSSWVERIDQDFETMLRLAAPQLSKTIAWELRRLPSSTSTSILQ